MFDHGTLIVLIPTQSGLVAASDSRLSLDGAMCDGVEKFLIAEKPERLLIAVTGRRGVWPVSIFTAPDKCNFIRTNRRDFDLGESAKAYVEAAAVPIEKIDLTALTRHCVDGWLTFFKSQPYRLDGTTSFSRLVLASYDPSSGITRIRIVDISFPLVPGGKINATVPFDIMLSPDDLAAPYVLGESDYYFEKVQPHLLLSAKRDATKKQLAQPLKIMDTTLRDGIDIAIEMIEATSQMTESVPAASGIGGPIDVRVIGNSPRPTKIGR